VSKTTFSFTEELLSLSESVLKSIENAGVLVLQKMLGRGLG